MSDFYWGGRYWPRPWDRPWRDPNTRATVRLLTRPVTEPLSLADARDHLRLTAYGSPLSHPDDGWLSGFGIGAAREYVEQTIGRSLAPQQFMVTLDSFPGFWNGNAIMNPPWSSVGGPWGHGIRLPLAAPLISVDSVVYTDMDGVDQTLVEGVDYKVQRYSEPAYIFPLYGLSWPIAGYVPDALRITYTAGYSDPGEAGSPFRAAGPDLPYLAAAGIRLMLGHLYENREAVVILTRGENMQEIPIGITSLLQPINLNLGVA